MARGPRLKLPWIPANALRHRKATETGYMVEALALLLAEGWIVRPLQKEKCAARLFVKSNKLLMRTKRASTGRDPGGAYEGIGLTITALPARSTHHGEIKKITLETK
jgi:hypothetical protein